MWRAEANYARSVQRALLARERLERESFDFGVSRRQDKGGQRRDFYGLGSKKQMEKKGVRVRWVKHILGSNG